jgi:hypothetical protein
LTSPGFGDQDVLAVAQGLHRHRHMELVGRAHENRVDLAAAAHLFVVGKHLHRFGQVLSKLDHPIFQQIAESNDSASGIAGDGQGVGLADAHSYDSDSYFLHGSSPWVCVLGSSLLRFLAV